MTRATWCLAIATYKRHAVLEQCVLRALAQSQPPSEVVIADASPDWAQGAARIEALCRDAGIACRYVKADLPSLTIQRNQTIDLATSDVLFMIDDDAMLFADSAERVLEVYEADVGARIAGVMLGTSERHPPPLDGQPAADTGDPIEIKASGRRRWSSDSAIGRVIYRELLLMSRERVFVPYEGSYPDHAMPDEVRQFGCFPVRLFKGYAMTYRRSVIAKVRFSSLLRGYCPAEDLDASYRASAYGCLVVAPQARIHHIEAASGRLKRRVATLLSASNIAVFLREHADGVRARKRDFAIMMLRRLLAELLKDIGSGRFDLPQVRGLLQSVPLSRRIFEIPIGELPAFYTQVQVDLLGQAPVANRPS